MSDFEFDHDGKSYAFDLTDITFDMATAVQKESGLTLSQFLEFFTAGSGDVRAVQALLWWGKKVAGEACRFGDLSGVSPFSVAIKRSDSAEEKSTAKAPGASLDPTSRGGRTRKPRTTATS